jgi:hypothetical protein
MTEVNDDYSSQNAQFTKKLESKLPLLPKPWLMLDLLPSLTPVQLVESDAKLYALKAMVENAIVLFYPSDSSTFARGPQMLDGLPTRSREIILTNMKQSMSLTLRNLKSLYPQANLDVVG